MNSRILMTGLSIILLTTLSPSQSIHSSIVNPRAAFLTGSLHNDLILPGDHVDGFDGPESNSKRALKNKYSPLAAGLFSAVVPGAGQFYTKSYWQSAAFFSVEVLTWVVYASYEKKGDQQTNTFQQFANDHWSVVRYTDWININYGRAISEDPDLSLTPWQRINWDELNAVEEQIAQMYPPTGFTHKLAPYSDQQYFEMIGKYSQFGGGWDDATAYTKADVIANNGIGNVSPRFLEYRDMRDKANGFYNIATTVSYVIVANHIFSMLEAAFNASKINHRIQLQGHIESRRIYGNLVEFVPTLQVKYEL
jgi:hypothetical protein